MSSRWPLAKLGDVTINHDARRVPVRESIRKPGRYPYYGASGVVDYVDGYLFDGLYLLIAEDGENLRTRQTPVAFLADGRFWVNNHAHIVTGNHRADTRYLSYALAVTDISGYLTGSAMPKLSQKSMNAIELPLPRPEVQKAIAAVLCSLDDKVEQNRRTVRALEGLARATFKAWFVDFEPVNAKAAGSAGFPGMPRDAFAALPDRLTDSPLGPVPQGWEVRPIGDVVSIKGGGTPSTKVAEYWEGGAHFWATPKDLSGLQSPVLLETERRITDAGAECISSGVMPENTVLLSSRAPVGYTAIAKVPLAVNQGFIAMLCDGPLPPHYVLHWTRSALEEIKSRACGTTFPEISKSAFRPIQAVVPPQVVVKGFERIVRSLFDLIEASARQSHQLEKLRDYLLPRLLSGSLRVRL
jgi:type I restriction enzyme S subunit